MNVTEKEFYKDIIDSIPNMIKEELLNMVDIKTDDFTRLIIAIKKYDIREMIV